MPKLISIMDILPKLLESEQVQKFTKTLNPADWDYDNPLFQELAKYWYRTMGTDSPVFKAWNHGSNEPLKVYHGTRATINPYEGFSFDYKKMGSKNGTAFGKGFYTTDNPEEARKVYTDGGSGTVLDLFSNIQNPSLNLSKVGGPKPSNLSQDEIVNITDNLVHNLIEKDPHVKAYRLPKLFKSKTNYLDSVMEEKYPDSYVESWGEVFPERFSYYPLEMIDMLGSEHYYDALRDYASTYPTTLEGISNQLKKQSRYNVSNKNILQAISEATGYDGIKLPHRRGDTHYIHWFPEQLKSQQNTGEFNPYSSNIFRGIIPFMMGGFGAYNGLSEE